MSSLQERLKNLRVTSDISVQNVADCCDVSRQAVYKWENGQSTPDINHLIKLVQLYKVSTEYIVLGVKEVDKSNADALLNDVLTKLSRAKDYSELVSTISEYLNDCGLDKFFYMQKFRGDISKEPYVFALSDLPAEWRMEYRDNKYATVDPAWEYCFSDVAPIPGDQLFAPLEISAQKGCKICEGFVNGMKKYVPYCVLIPVHGGCCLSAFVVSTKTDKIEDKQLLEKYTDAITLIGHHLYSEVHRLQELENTHPNSELSDKEIAAIAHLAAGNNVEKIADLLCITKAAVNARIDRAKLKLGAKNREQLVLYAASRNILPHNLSGIQTENPNRYQYRQYERIA